MHKPYKQPEASLYRVDADLSVHRMDAGYICANGPAFSVDGSRLYHADSAQRVVYAFDLDGSGNLSGKRIFTRFGDDGGVPDGMTTDSRDGLWIAHNGGGKITRFLPNGSRDFAIAAPVHSVTSLAFGGTDFDRLFVTSARNDDANSGCVFEVSAAELRGCKGLPPNRFAG